MSEGHSPEDDEDEMVLESYVVFIGRFAENAQFPDAADFLDLMCVWWRAATGDPTGIDNERGRAIRAPPTASH